MKRVNSGNDWESDSIVDAALEALKPDKKGEGLLAPLDELSERRLTDRVFSKFDEYSSASCCCDFGLSAMLRSPPVSRLVACLLISILCGICRLRFGTNYWWLTLLDISYGSKSMHCEQVRAVGGR